MYAWRTSRWLLPSTLLTAAAVVLVLPLSGCDDDDDDNNDPGTSLFGTYADEAGNSGTIELVSVSPLGQEEGTPLDGELRIGGFAPVPLTGTFDSDTGDVAFASDDGTYNFNGTVAAGQGTGFGFGPNGAATFVVFLGATSSSVDTYCGTATCTSPPGCDSDGTFNLVVDGSQALLTVNVDGTVGVGTGTATSQDVDFDVEGTEVDVTIHGDISGNNVTGTWTNEANGTSGTWIGSTSQCQAARR